MAIVTKGEVVRQQIRVSNTDDAERTYNISALATYFDNIVVSIEEGVVGNMDASFSQINGVTSTTFYNKEHCVELMTEIDNFIKAL